MKKLLAIVLSLAMVLSVVVLPAAVNVSAETPAFKVYKEDFENGLPQYSMATDEYAEGTANSYTGCLSDRYAHSGQYSYEFHTYDAGWKVGYVPVGSVEEGKTYIVDLYYYIDADRSIYGNGHAGAMRIVGDTAAPTNFWAGNAVQAELLPVTACWQFVHQTREMGWRHVSAKFTATVSNGFYAVFNTDSAICIDAYMDDITLTEVTDEQVVVTFQKEHALFYNQYSTVQLAGVEGTPIDYVPEAEPGYAFAGWYAEESCTTPVTTWSSDYTNLYPSWKKAEGFENASMALQNTGSGGTMVSVDEGTGVTGNSLKFNAANSNYGRIGGFLLDTGITTNTTYMVEFDYKITAACNQPVKVLPVLANPTNIWGQVTAAASYPTTFSAGTTTSGWEKGAIAFTTPASLNGATGIYINIQVPAASASSGTIYFDNFVISKAPGGSVIVGLNGNGGDCPVPFVVAKIGDTFSAPAPKGFAGFKGWYQDPACLLPLTTVTSSTNAAYAGWDSSFNSFETYSPAAWSSDVYSLNNNPAYAHSGNNSIHYNGAVAWTNKVAPFAQVKPNTDYVLDFWYYTPSAPTANVAFRFITYAGSTSWPCGECINTDIINTKKNQYTGDDGYYTNWQFKSDAGEATGWPVWTWYTGDVGQWKHAYVRFTTNATANYTTLALNTMGMTNGTAEFYLDDFTLTEVPAGSTSLVIYNAYNDQYSRPAVAIAEEGAAMADVQIPGLGDLTTDSLLGFVSKEDTGFVVDEVSPDYYLLNATWRAETVLDFEDGNCSAYAHKFYSVEDKPEAEGKALRISAAYDGNEGTGVKWTNYGYPVAQVNPGSTYVLSFDYYVAGGNSIYRVFPVFADGTNIWANADVQIPLSNFVTQSFDPDEPQYKINYWEKNDPQWVHEEFVVEVPTNAHNGTTLWFSFLCSPNVEGEGDVDMYFDNITLTGLAADEVAIAFRNTYTQSFNNRTVAIGHEGDAIADIIDFEIGTTRTDEAEVLGYYTDPSCDEAYEIEYVPEDSATVYLCWESKINVTFIYNGTSVVKQFNKGSEIEYPDDVIVPEGKAYVWSVDGVTIYDETVADADITITAYVFAYGDVNNDNDINVKDLARLAKKLAGQTVEIGFGADCDGNGDIGATDLVRLKKYIAGVEDTVLG